MSAAVATKPRAKPRGKTGPAAVSAALRPKVSSISTKLEAGRIKLAAALKSMDATDPGEAAHVLLHFIEQNTLPEALAELAIRPWNDDLVEQAYSAMFPSLAALEGVIALAKGNIAESTLREAHALLDQAHSEMGFANVGGAKVCDSTATDRSAEDFIRGRDIAIKMIDEGRALSGERDCYRRHRDAGAAQDNFVNGYLSDIIAEPALRQGFTSVLSQIVGAGECFDGSYFRHLSLAETRGGTPGEDDTRADDSEPVQDQQAGADVLHDFDLLCLMLQARDVAECAADAVEEMPTSASLWAVATLTEVALEKTREATAEGATVGVCRDASAKVEEAISVANLLNSEGGADMAMLYVLETLLKLAARGLDELERRMSKAAACPRSRPLLSPRLTPWPCGTPSTTWST